MSFTSQSKEGLAMSELHRYEFHVHNTLQPMDDYTEVGYTIGNTLLFIDRIYGVKEFYGDMDSMTVVCTNTKIEVTRGKMVE